MILVIPTISQPRFHARGVFSLRSRVFFSSPPDIPAQCPQPQHPPPSVKNLLPRGGEVFPLTTNFLREFRRPSVGGLGAFPPCVGSPLHSNFFFPQLSLSRWAFLAFPCSARGLLVPKWALLVCIEKPPLAKIGPLAIKNLRQGVSAGGNGGFPKIWFCFPPQKRSHFHALFPPFFISKVWGASRAGLF